MLTIHDAFLEPGPDGTEELAMTVTDTGNGPEHLYDVLTPNAASAQLRNADNAPITGTGILLNPNTPVVFGAGGPRILLDKPTGLRRGVPVTISLIFADAGLIHLAVVPERAAARASD